MKNFKRVLKYLGVLILSMIFFAFLDSCIERFVVDPWITFKDDWHIIYGAMAYRIVTTWEPKVKRI